MRRWWAVGVVLWLVSAAAVAGPTLRSGTSISVDVVACDGGFDCWLARRFVPSSWVTAGGELVFDGTPADFKLPAPSLIGHGETVGETPSVDAVRFDTPRTLAGTSIVPFTVDRSLNPDHYRGVLRVAVGETAIEIPTEIRVRRGPLLPLLCIIIGLALGMLSRWWSLTGEKKKRALDKLEQFASQISRDPAASIAILTTMLDRLREQVERGELDIDAELAKVMVRRYQLARVARFDHIERLETRVAQVRALI